MHKKCTCVCVHYPYWWTAVGQSVSASTKFVDTFSIRGQNARANSWEKGRPAKRSHQSNSEEINLQFIRSSRCAVVR